MSTSRFRRPLASALAVVFVTVATQALVPAGALVSNVRAAGATSLTFVAPPGGGPAWQAFATQPVVGVVDGTGATDTTSTATIQLAISSGTAGATLSCSGGTTVVAVAGIATFSGCWIDKTGTYTLVASAAGLAPATSTSFNVTAAQEGLAYATQPGGGAAGSVFATQPVIQIQDPGGTVDTSNSTSMVTLQIGTNPGGGTLTCGSGLSVKATFGVIAFSGCKIDKPGNGYTITATSPGLTGTTSAPFNVSAGPVASIVFSTQPGGGAAGVAISPQPVVSFKDSVGNTVTTTSATVGLTIVAGTGTSGASLSCSGGTVRSAVNGVVSFSGCSIDKAGSGYKLLANASGLTPVQSASFTINTAPPTNLVVTTQPSSSAGAATAFATQPVIAVRDAMGQTVTSSSLAVTLAITGGTGTAGANLSCSSGTTKSASGGIVSFSGCSIDKLGVGYTLTATATGVTGATTAPITIVAGAASKLGFTTQPVGGAFGLPFATQPVVSVQDSLGNTVPSSSVTVTLAITAGTGVSGAALSCGGGNSKAASSGVAAFTGCSINKVGTAYRLTATATGLTSATSGTFDITVGAPSRLAFITQPGGATVGGLLTPQPIVAIQDAAGNTVTSSSVAVSLVITAGTGGSSGAGASLACSSPVTANNGVAAFSTCSLDKTGTGFTLTATGGGLTQATSATFTITAASAVRLAFSPQPVGGAVGSVLSVQPTVVVQDATGNTVTTSTASVTLSLGTNPSGGVLSCSGSLTKTAVAGVAAFTGCKIDKVGSGYTLTAIASGLMGATSAPLNIVAGFPQKLAFTTQPVGGAYGAPFTTQPVVAAEDSLGNVVTSYNGTVVLSITALTGTSGAVLTCTGGLAMATTNGVAAFPGCSIDKPGTGYTLTATMTGVTTAISSALTVTAGPPTHVAFSTQPAGASAGVAFTTQPVIGVLDAAGNVAPGSSAIVSLAITSGTGAPGASLTCTGGTSIAAVAGVARFSGCRIDRVGTGYTLTASAVTLTSGASNSFSVAAGPAAKLAFTTQPVGGAVGVAFPTQPVVAIEDAGGNIVTTSTLGVTLAITSGTGTTGATLTCTGGLTKTAASGVAAFSGCALSKVGAGYTIKASSGSLLAATSTAIVIDGGAPAKLSFTTQPAGGTVSTAFGTQPVVSVLDGAGGLATSSSAVVTLALGSAPSGATLTCSGGLSRTAAAGIATFAGCAVDKPGTAITIVATATALASATSSGFVVTPGAPSRLVITTQPSSTSQYAKAFATQPVVQVQDSAGNPTGTQAVAVAITTGTGTAAAKLICSGGLSKTSVAGIASFAGCAIDKAGIGYTLTFTSGSLPSVVSNAITITPGPPTKLLFTAAPPATVGGGSPFTPQPVVAIVDAAGNTVTSSTLTVTLKLTAAAGSTAVLSCTGGLTKAAVGGVATFSGCAIDKAGTGYAITASATGLTDGKTSTITVTAGAAAKVGFTTQPIGAVGGAAFTKQPVVAIQDAPGSTVTTSAASVTLAIATGTGSAGAVLTCTGGLSKLAVKGVVTFAGCAIDKAGTGYKLTATATGLTAATSDAFDISQGPAKQLAFATQPAGGPGGVPFATQPIVAADDAGGALVASSTVSVTLAITAGTGTTGAVLTCDGGLAKAATAGSVAFSGCSIDRAGTGYTLTATASGLTTAVSKPFNVSAPVARITITPAARSIAYGRAADLAIAFSYGGANASVDLEESTNGSTWSLVSPVTMDATGQATFTYLITSNRWFRTRYAGDSELLAGTSKAIRVYVTQSVGFLPKTRTTAVAAKRGKAVTVTSIVRPNGSGVPRTVMTFEIWKSVHGKWAFVARRVVASGSGGKTRFTWTFRQSGLWSIRARASATVQNQASPWSVRQQFKVS